MTKVEITSSSYCLKLLFSRKLLLSLNNLVFINNVFNYSFKIKLLAVLISNKLYQLQILKNKTFVSIAVIFEIAT